MHGRQRVERTVDEERAREKERAKKLKAYQHLMSLIFEKRSSRSLDTELLQLSAQVLSANPDVATLWNIRREVLLHLRNSGTCDFANLVTKDLDLVEQCLRSNPKSYGAWHHRCWLIKETEFERVPGEVQLCTKYLALDERNFHCWNYRRYLLDNSSFITMKDELDFTTKKIISNFSNYSSWHLRSTLLPRLSQEFLSEELELVKNAAFTDPNDQSVWLYHRWLLMSQLPKETPELIYSHLAREADEKVLLVVFSVPNENPNNLPCLSALGLPIGEVQLNSSFWTNPWGSSRSKLWIFRNTEITKELKADICSKPFPEYFDIETRPKSQAVQVILQSELEWVRELNELEEDNKWILSTLMLLMRLLDFRKFRPEIELCLEKILKLDPNRSNYYHDLRSKYLIEWKLVDLPVRCEEIDLSNLNLTSAYYLERGCAFKSVNLSGNCLTSCEPLGALVACENLNLTGNKITSRSTVDSVLKKLKNLKKIELSGNPLEQGGVCGD